MPTRVLVLLCCLSVAACGDGSTPSPKATVTGTVRGYGGPLIMNHGKPHMAIDGAPETNQRITARRSDGLIVRATTDSKGRYTLSLLPGHWSVQAACSLPVSLTFRSEQRTRVPLRCDFP